jgi:hypothetical protein
VYKLVYHKVMKATWVCLVMVGLCLAGPACAQDYENDPFNPLVARDAWTLIAETERANNVPPGLLHAMSLVETGQGIRGWVLPWPYTVGVNSSGTFNTLKADEALAHLKSRRALGFVRFDMAAGLTSRSKLKYDAALAFLAANPTASFYRITPAPFGRRFNSAAEATAFVNRMFASGYRNMDLGLMQINWKVHGSKFNNVSELFRPERNVNYAVNYLLEHRQTRDWWGSVGRYHSGTPYYANRYIRNVYNMYKRIHRLGRA